MDRKIVYQGAIPQDTDILVPQRSALVALGQLAADLLGSGTYIKGLECTPGAGLSIQIAAGSLYSSMAVDTSPFGSLPVDARTITKSATLSAATVLNTPVSSNVGNSKNHLIEARILEADGTPVTLPYYNSVNPGSPLSGAGGNGATQNTMRTKVLEVRVTSGASAPTGTQLTPAVSAGYVPLYVVTGTYGQATITADKIVKHPNIPGTVAKALLDQLLTVDGPGSGLSADTLGGEKWVVVAEGSITHTPAYYGQSLYTPPTPGHRLYAVSAYSPQCQVVQGHKESTVDDVITVYQGTVPVVYDRPTVMADWHSGGAGNKTLYYKIWEWK